MTTLYINVHISFSWNCRGRRGKGKGAQGLGAFTLLEGVHRLGSSWLHLASDLHKSGMAFWITLQHRREGSSIHLVVVGKSYMAPGFTLLVLGSCSPPAPTALPGGCLACLGLCAYRKCLAVFCRVSVDSKAHTPGSLRPFLARSYS